VRGLAIDERTAVLLEPDGTARVAGENAAFFLTLKAAVALKKSEPVSLPAIDVVRLQAGASFNLKNVQGGESYKLTTSSGKVKSTLASTGLYR
jgi:cyanophycinase-like exopeptidase